MGEGNAMKIVPLGDYIVVRRLDAESMSAGGIVLPDTAQEKSKQGRVLSVGDGKLLANGARSAPEVHEGDRIFFNSYAGTEVTVDEEKLLIINSDEIMAIVG